MALHIYGIIGYRWDELDTASIKNALSEEDEDGPLDVYINSPGGDVWAGIAIMSMLSRRKGKVTAHIDGLAASAATILMLGADEVVMPSNAMIMIHNPWMIAGGDYRDMAKASEDLEKIRDAMVAAYKDKTGKDEEELKNLLDGETWMTAQEAVEHGFVDRIGESVAEASLQQRLGTIDFTKFERAPEDFAAVAKVGRRKIAAMAALDQQGAENMPKKKAENQGPAAAPSTAEAEEVVVNAPANVVARESRLDEDAIRAQAIREEGERRSKIRALCRKHGLQGDTVDQIVNLGHDVQASGLIILDHLAKSSAANQITSRGSSIEVGVDSFDKFKAMGVNSIRAKTGGEKTDPENPMRGKSFLQLAEACIRRNGGVPEGNPREIFAQAYAMGTHTTSDFGEILKDAMNKDVLRGYNMVSDGWREFCSEGVNTDFRERYYSSLNATDSFKEVGEGEEYKTLAVGEGGASVGVGKYGGIIAITEEMLRKDDQGQFTRLAVRVGATAARVPAKIAYGILTDTAGLFSAANGNAAATALGYDSLDAGFVAMRTQDLKSPNGDDQDIELEPAVMMVPATLFKTATQLAGAEVESAEMQPNVYRGRFTVVSSNILDRNDKAGWYLAANPQLHDVIQIDFLDGISAPQMEQKDEFNVDQTSFKARVVCGGSHLDHKGLYRGGIAL